MAPPSLTKEVADGVAGHVDSTHKPPSSITLENGRFLAGGQPFFVDVPPNVVATPASSLVCSSKGLDTANGCFVGFDAPDGAAKSWHAAPLGRLLDIKFMSIFRFKVWWTTHWVGTRGRDVEHETQFLLLDRDEASGRPYVLVLPIIEGAFRAALQPGADDNVDVCVESSSTKVTSASFGASVYLHSAGDDPFAMVKEAMKVVRAHLDTFRLLDEKTAPGIVDKFGWCTWDAFYLKVHPHGVWDGVKGLVEGGCPPGLVLIDDGWQSICHDEDDPLSGQEGMNRTSAGEQMPCRLIKFGENYKFRDYESRKGTGEKGMAVFTRELKEEFRSVEDIYVWHALCGYWGGLRPGVEGLPEAKVIAPKLTPGLEMTMEDLAVDKIVNNGVGLAPPERAGEMYEGLHSHLASVGIDGVKVDVIHLLEMLCEEYGGRVDLAKAYYKAISDSVRRHFKGNGVIASMEHCNDFMFLGTDAISLGRVGDDFWCTDPAGDINGTFWLQGCHMVHCAYNSLWMGNFIHPDWDMFQSTHPCAEFHAASRAISGGPIYVSDSVGQHNFPLLKSLTLPDGTILRCEYYALPTRDCLFVDPLHDGATMLKIWNINKFTGVLGAFNCQGGGWSREARRNKCFSEYSKRIKTIAHPNEIEWKSGKSPISIEGVELFAVYWFHEGKLELLKQEDGVEITLDPFNFELLTVSPVKVLSSGVQFAPIGLVNMLNTGGALQTLDVHDRGNSTAVLLGVKGAGDLKAYSSEKPTTCKINGEEISFSYDDNVVKIKVPWQGISELSLVEYLY